MGLYFRPLALLVVLFLAMPGSSPSSGFLHTSGKTIRDGSGKEVLLRGIGLGGWLVPEGYMLQTSSFANSPTAIRKVISDLVGIAPADAFFQSYRQNYVASRDIDSIAAWGFNSIRLPMHYNLLTPKNQPGVYSEEGFAQIDSLLNWCEANQLYLILDLHCAPGGQNALNISDYITGEPSLWESASNQQRAIREVDTNHIVFIEGNDFATDFEGLTPPWDDNFVYSFHKYWNSNDASSISGYIALRENYDVPLWLGESGENGNHWFTECIALMESNSIGWAWWPHKKIESVAGPLSARTSPGYDYLLRYWRNEVSRPTTAFAIDALMAQAESLKIQHCTMHRDVLDALLRLPGDNTRRPFATNTIPGMIYASNYDMGRNGIAYRDAEFQNTGSTDWNMGWSYRNDGVDIEQCSDIYANGFDVGWTAASEFLTYTVNVLATGTYAIGLRVAAPQSGGSVLMRWDAGVMMPVVAIPQTGGWQTWTTVPLGQYALTAGTHDFRIDILSGGFNIASTTFSTVNAVDQANAGVPRVFELSQNYPNPFNPSTTIRYALPYTSHVRISVFNMLGQEVARLVDEAREAGNNEVQFEGGNLSSGLYVCRMLAGGFTGILTMVLLR
ncbi:MAG: Endoglucanase [Bacteroidetes bacterium]|nr:Endoglucanase [Bacteroidota bacterium]